MITLGGAVVLGVLAARGVLGFVQDYKHFKGGVFTWKSLISYWKQSVK